MIDYTPDEKFRFLSKITIPNNPDECWLWRGSCLSSGYGVLAIRGKNKRIHRMMWEIVFGEIPSELFVCHQCDTRNCCNPKHLFLGTTQENTQDKVNKGRQAHNNGLKSGHSAKLNPEQVEEIRRKYDQGGMTQYELAAEYKVGQGHISRIVHKSRWY